jgi:hypothetical protein
MKVSVYSVYSDFTNTFQGEPEQIRNQLNATYSFLKRYKGKSLQEDLAKLSQQQALMVSVED